jgi:dGTPase
VNTAFDLELDGYASAEAQVAAVSDDIAYNHHDLHDGLRAGLFTLEDLGQLPVVGPALAEVDALWPDLEPMRRRHETLRRVFGRMVEDVIDIAKNRLAAAKPESAQDIRDMNTPLIRFSKTLYMELKAIKSYLFTHMYRAPSVVVERKRVTQVIEDLFPLFLKDPSLLPEDWRADVARAGDQTELARVVLDYVAGMTDRFAIAEHERLCGGVGA